MDILFKNDDFVFSYRVGGILIHDGKILLQRPENDDYAIIGGHVAAMETSMETLILLLPKNVLSALNNFSEASLLLYSSRASFAFIFSEVIIQK